jgi:hypothetical protein
LVAVGTCTIQATQAGNSNYAAATPVNQSFQVTQASQTISFGALSNEALGTAPFTVSATASSGLPVSFASTTQSVCTVSGATVTLVAVGTCTIQATQAGNSNYAAATPVNQSFQVTSETMGAGGNIALVQHATHDNGTTKSNTVVVTLNGVAGGDLLTCSATFGDESSAYTLSVADNVNGAWSVANAPHFDSANTQITGQFYRANSAAGNITITLTYSGPPGEYGAMNCQEWANAATSSPLDQDTQQDGTTANPSSGSITTTANGDLILGGLENVQSPTAGRQFTRIDSTPTSWLSTEYQIQSGAGPVAATWTATATDWTTQVAAFKPAASGSSNIVTSATYATSGTSQPIGSITGLTFGSGDSDRHSYDVNTGQYTFAVNGATDQATLTWNANGTLQTLAIVDAINSTDTQTCNYRTSSVPGYDDLGRIANVSCGSTWGQSFTYDPFGNITKSTSISRMQGYSYSTDQ